MRTLRGFAWASTIATYVLIFTGGLVRVSGAGLGCPDWPKCFGRWLPPTSVDQLPANIDPSLFNFTLAWIEYGNRMLGMLVGLLILVTAVLALVHARKNLKIWLPAVLAAILVAYTGWQGGQVVAAGLEPILVSVHTLLSFLIATLLLYLTLQLHFLNHPEAEIAPVYPEKYSVWVGIAWLLLLVQSVLGTQLRAAVKLIGEARPLGGASAWIDAVGPLSHIHQTLGVLVAGIAIHIGFKLVKRSGNPSPLVFQSSWGLILLGVLQIVLGLAMVLGSFVPILQLLHLWVASLMVGLFLLTYAALRKHEGGAIHAAS